MWERARCVQHGGNHLEKRERGRGEVGERDEERERKRGAARK